MGISKFSEQPHPCIGGALIFSGRPNPTWQVSEKVAQKLKETWNELEPLRGKHPSAPAMGYRGCFLRCDAEKKEWFAYKGMVTLWAGDIYQFRKDTKRRFERQLLSSAPPATVPSSILDAENLR
ncbi:MAG: hypothetical protein ACE14S_09155 [Candidatus Bathyarchaeia archaeon]